MFNHTPRAVSRVLASVLALAQALPLSMLAQHAQAQQVSTTQYGYDAQGNRTTITDPRSLVTNIAPDTLDRTQTITGPAPTSASERPTVTYGYDGQGRWTSIQDPRGNTTSRSYSGLGDFGQVSPDTGVRVDKLDPMGNVRQRFNAKLQQTTITYDALNRPFVLVADGRATVLGYDATSTASGAENYGIGHLTSITEYAAGGTSQISRLAFTYDQHGRLTSRCQLVSATDSQSCTAADQVVYRWDSGNTGRLNGLTYPSGRLVDYTYDAQDNIVAITTTTPGASPQAVINTITYVPLASGHVEANSWAFGNSGVYQAYTRHYDLDGRIDQFSLGLGSPAVSYLAALYKLTYDPASRIQSIAALGGGDKVSYGYDDLDRLTLAVLSNITYSYGYDLNGNRIAQTWGNSSYSLTYPSSNNRLASVQPSGSGALNLVTDASGNVTDDASLSAGRALLGYDWRSDLPLGRLISSQGQGGQFAYVNNFLGQRARKTGRPYTPSGGSAITPQAYVGSTDTTFHYDMQGHLIAELDAGTKAVKREIIWLGDTPVGVIAGADPTQMVSASNAATLYYVHTDQLNTPRLITDTAGNVRWKWPVTGEPFGNTSPSETPTSGQTAFTFNLRFPGQYADSETGTFYNYFRTYNPQTGRYLQSDPIGLDGGFNTYAYVGGDPIRFTDEMGLSASGSSQGGSPQRKCDGDKCTEDPATDVSCFAQCSDGASCQQCCHKQANKLAQSGTNPEAIGIRFILECTKSCILKDAPPQQGSPSNPPDKPWICKLLPWKCRASGKAGK